MFPSLYPCKCRDELDIVNLPQKKKKKNHLHGISLSSSGVMSLQELCENLQFLLICVFVNQISINQHFRIT